MMSRRGGGFDQGREWKYENMPLPEDEDDNVHTVTLGNKTYTFENEEEAMAFIFLIKKKQVNVSDAYDYILKLREQGFFEDGGTQEDENLGGYNPFSGY